MQEFLTEKLNYVEEKLKSVISSKDEFVGKIAHYLFARKGKRIRPALLLLSYFSCKENSSKILPEDVSSIAAVIEMLHTASLIHDDVIDSSGVRRGRETVNYKWGNKISTLMGDYLYSKAASIMSYIGNNQILKVITEATSEMCEGEMNQVYDSFNPAISKRKYIDTITKKTASLFGASCEAGVILAKGNQQSQNILRNFGINVGISFQIIDDILDIVSDNGNIGKPVGSDLKEGKITLPYIYVFRLAGPKDKKVILDTIGQNDGFIRVKSILKKYKVIDYSKEKAVFYNECAKEILKKIPDSIAKNELIKISDFVIKRTH